MEKITGTELPRVWKTGEGVDMAVLKSVSSGVVVMIVGHPSMSWNMTVKEAGALAETLYAVAQEVSGDAAG